SKSGFTMGSKSHSEEFPPYIIDHPTDLVVRWDQPATLNCRVAGSPAPTIGWYRNGEYVETSKDNVYSQRTLLPDGSLFFLRLNQRKGQSDEGVYTCVATNHLGTASSKNASLYIAALREDFRLQPSDLLVTVGEQVLLECVPPRGHPEPTISWKKDGVPISQKVSSGKLLMVHAQRSDAGLYVCVASNQAGQRESKAALVSVLGEETVPCPLGLATVQLGCGVEGDPLPKVWWHKELGELPWGRYVMYIRRLNTLRIHYVTTLDSGKYICTAQNQVGTASAKASLTVQGKQLHAAFTASSMAGLGHAHEQQRDLSAQHTLLPECPGNWGRQKVVTSDWAHVTSLPYPPTSPISSGPL
uniref:Ig-like domain-containing protein n=1 Tax=Gopherus evgoodei TaxID=1825980 RepID=A0A8C4YSS9_9SAUR